MRNFLSVGNVTQAIHLNDSLLTLVLGDNLDSNNGSTRNGAGKTTLVQALSFALYGQPLTKIKLDNLINNINQKNMLVTIDFSIDDKEYRIERGRKPNVMKLYANGSEIVENDTQGENKETQIDIVKIIGMSHNMFTQVVALNTYTTPFLKQRISDQREVIEELFGVTQISMKAELLKKMSGITKNLITSEHAKINAITEANARIDKAIEHANKQHADWEKTHSTHVQQLAEQIDGLRTIDFDNEKNIFDLLDAWNTKQRDALSKIDMLNSQISNFKRDRLRMENTMSENNIGSFQKIVTSLESDLERKKYSLNEYRDTLKKHHDSISSKKAEIENADGHTCTTCEQPLKGTNHLGTIKGRLENQLSELQKKVVNTEKNISSVTAEIEEIEVSITKAIDDKTAHETSIAEAKQKNANKIIELNNEIKNLEDQIDNIKDNSNDDDDKPRPLFSDRDELYSTKQLLDTCVADLERERSMTNPFSQNIESLVTTRQSIDYSELEKLKEELTHQDFLHKLLVNKDSFIRRKIIDQNLAYLNQRISHYTEKFGLPHEVTFLSDLSVDITQLGQDYDFDQLSRGEQLRVILSVSWSFRDVWESLNHSINLIWIDEMLDAGVDSSGAEAGLSVLKSMGRDRAKNVFLISHRDELIGRIESIMMVTKQNGFTNVGEYAQD